MTCKYWPLIWYYKYLKVSQTRHQFQRGHTIIMYKGVTLICVFRYDNVTLTLCIHLHINIQQILVQACAVDILHKDSKSPFTTPLPRPQPSFLFPSFPFCSFLPTLPSHIPLIYKYISLDSTLGYFTIKFVV